MQEAWLQLQCPACDKHWEATAADLPSPDTAFDCDDCETVRPLSEFMKTARDLELLRDLQ
jgi:predicted  nucleic acid-binding Zn ribbon protein